METTTIKRYDRLRGGLEKLAAFSKPTTIKDVTQMTGDSETYVIETARHEGGDYIFIEALTKEGLVRMALPPRAANAIARQREGLTKRLRKQTAKRLAQERMAAGCLPRFTRKSSSQSLSASK